MPVPVSSTRISAHGPSRRVRTVMVRWPGAIAPGRGDGVGGVDQQIHDHPVDVRRKAVNRRQIGVEIGDHFGHVFPFVAAESDRPLDGMVQVNGLLPQGVGVGELLHGADDAGHVLHAFQRLPDGLGNLGRQIVEVGAANFRFQLRQQFVAHVVPLSRLQETVVGLQQRADLSEGILEKAGIVADVLRGGVDLVGDPGGKLSDGLHLLGLGQLLFHPLFFQQHLPLPDGPVPTKGSTLTKPPSRSLIR